MNENEDRARYTFGSGFIERMKERLRNTKQEILERQVDAGGSYPSPARILAGSELKRAVRLYLDLALILGRLVELEGLGPALDAILEDSPNGLGSTESDRNLLAIAGERTDLKAIVLIAEIGYIPYLYLTAHSRGLDPSPFVRCRENLTQATLADAIALAERLLTIAEDPPEDRAGESKTTTPDAAGAVRVVLWEGAEHSERNIRLARTRTAYLEANGNVREAMDALKDSGNKVARSTFYDHLAALDKAIPGWRHSVRLSGQAGNPDSARIVGKH